MQKEHKLVDNLIQFCFNIDNPYIFSTDSSIKIKDLMANNNITIIRKLNDSIRKIIYFEVSYNKIPLHELSLSQLYDFLLDFYTIYDTYNDRSGRQSNVFNKIDLILKLIKDKITDKKIVDTKNETHDDLVFIKIDDSNNNQHISFLLDEYNKLKSKYKSLEQEFNDHKLNSQTDKDKIIELESKNNALQQKYDAFVICHYKDQLW